MSERERILARVAAAANRHGATAARRDNVARRLADPIAHPVPARVAGQPAAALTGILRHWLERAAGEMQELATAAEVPRAIARYLASHNVAARIRIGADPWLNALPWQDAPALEVVHGPAADADTASVTHAMAAVAESGTVLVASGPDNPVTLSFLPATNMAVVEREAIVGSYEQAFAMVRAAALKDGLPRTLNMISGPSRSADIGGIPVQGAHGPGRFCLLVVG